MDGVLINSLPAMKTAWDSVRIKFDISIGFSDYKIHLGVPFNNILHKLDIPTKLHNQIKQQYDEVALTQMNKIKLYDGVKSTLQYLKKNDTALSILTSKTKNRTKEILSFFDIDQYFQFVISPEDLPLHYAKPSPMALKQVLELFSINPEKLLFIGDMISDKCCADSAGTAYYHCQYGYQPINTNNSLFHFEDLKRILNA